MTASLQPWADYVDLLKAAAEVEHQLWDPQDPQLRAELYRQFAMNLSQGYFLYFQADPDHPDWAPFENSVFLAQPNPDAVYHYSAVSGSGIYRVQGNRGNVPVAGFATGKNMIGMANPPGPGFNNYDLDMLEIAEDGSFEVIFSNERPQGHTGNWLYLHPESRFLLLRQFSYDWGHERDVRVAIERLDHDELKPSMSVEAIDQQLRELFGGYVKRLSQLCQGIVRNSRDSRPLHQMQLVTYSELGNGDDWPQAYYECVYELQPGEALILETELPQQHVYWNVQVVDALWNQVELVHRQSSLNGHQAHLDSDGRFRAVLSVEDPGIANWLDCGGNLRGMLIGRWYRSSSHPTPTLTKVKFAELHRHLPADTPRTTPAQRAEALRTRRIGAQLRRRW
ncbi:hypothetical protein D3C84_178610 [compost metagenome]